MLFTVLLPLIHSLCKQSSARSQQCSWNRSSLDVFLWIILNLLYCRCTGLLESFLWHYSEQLSKSSVEVIALVTCGESKWFFSLFSVAWLSGHFFSPLQTLCCRPLVRMQTCTIHFTCSLQSVCQLCMLSLCVTLYTDCAAVGGKKGKKMSWNIINHWWVSKFDKRCLLSNLWAAPWRWIV